MRQSYMSPRDSDGRRRDYCGRFGESIVAIDREGHFHKGLTIVRHVHIAGNEGGPWQIEDQT